MFSKIHRSKTPGYDEAKATETQQQCLEAGKDAHSKTTVLAKRLCECPLFQQCSLEMIDSPICL